MNNELDENQLGYVNAGYSANNAQERAEVLVNNIFRQYISDTISKDAIKGLAIQGGFKPEDIYAMLEAKAKEIQGGMKF